MAKTYTTKLGDTWDVVSYECYGREVFVADLVRANYEHRNIAVFSGGVKLTVPPISVTRRDDTNLPPWRRGR